MKYERGHRLVPLDIVEAYGRELGVPSGTLVVLHRKAHLELYGDDLSRRQRADHPWLREELGSPTVLDAVPGRAVEPGLKDLQVLMPEPVASFTGRSEELHWLAEARTGPVVVTQAFAGMGGVGKTALALEYAYRCFYVEHSVDLAWWFVAADRLSLRAAMASLYEQLAGVPGGEDNVLAAERESLSRVVDGVS